MDIEYVTFRKVCYVGIVLKEVTYYGNRQETYCSLP
jgi:hypothetical protein